MLSFQSEEKNMSQHEILSVKLGELDDTLSRLHSRIQLSEKSDQSSLDSEIRKAETECRKSKEALFERLHYSKSKAVEKLSLAYDAVESSLNKLKKEEVEETPDEKILIAEYSLDFALLAAQNALLRSLEAINAVNNEERRA